jgi:hypothetical protein
MPRPLLYQINTRVLFQEQAAVRAGRLPWMKPDARLDRLRDLGVEWGLATGAPRHSVMSPWR